MDSLSQVELFHLRQIIEGLDSLAEIEKEHPELGRQLYNFIERISSACEKAYMRLSDALGEVRTLPARPTPDELESLIKKINDVPSSKWFKDVEGICGQLAALIDDNRAKLQNQLDYLHEKNSGVISPELTNTYAVSPTSMDEYFKIANLFNLLEGHEASLKDDLRRAVYTVQTHLGNAKSTLDV